MKTNYSLFPAILFIAFASFQSPVTVPSPLDDYSREWGHERFNKCYTATTASYMNEKEREVIHILNLLRTDPPLFARTVLAKYPERSGQSYLKNIPEFKSLMKTLQQLQPIGLLYPDEKCFRSAQCHAISSGTRSYIGHERLTAACKSAKYFSGECCDYGHDDPLDILLSLLIDESVPSLGHRLICLDGGYTRLGVSIQPHKEYGTNAVMDFK